MKITYVDAHTARHQFLHRAVDELVADYIAHTGHLLSETNLIELMEWSFKQTKRADTPLSAAAARHREGLEQFGEETEKLLEAESTSDSQ